MRSERYESLDGLRGCAALAVAIFHFLCAYVPGAISEYVDPPWRGSDTPLAILYNGGFSVTVFFVLSGFVVANSAAKRHLPVVFNLCQRYGRLAVPVLAGTLFGWLLLTIFPHAVPQLKLAEPGAGWLNDVYDGDLPGLARAAFDGSFLVFWHGYSFFNNPLWTMQIELIGSWLLYVIYGLSQDRMRISLLIAYLALPLLLALPEFSAFAAGALLREAVVAHRLPKRWPIAALVFGLVFGAMMKGYGDRVGLHFPALVALGQPHKLWHVAAAISLMYAILNLDWLNRFLAGPVGRFLGRISFGLYLVHAPLLYTVFALAYLALPAHDAFWIALLLAGFVPAVILLGYLFALLVDQPVLRAIHAAQEWRKARTLRIGARQAAPE